MSIFNNVLPLLLSLLCSLPLMGQSKQSAHFQHNKMQRVGVDIKPHQFFKSPSFLKGIDANDQFTSIKIIENKSGQHIKYQQAYKNIPVEGGIYYLHYHKNILSQGSGNIYPNIDIDTEPSISASTADKIAQRVARAHAAEHHHPIHDLQSNSPSLVIMDRNYPTFSGQYALAYKVNLQEMDGTSNETYYVDAHKGQVRFVENHICNHGVPSRGQSFYYGEVHFTSDSLGPEEFHLHDPDRNITIENGRSRSVYTGTSSNWNLVNETMDEVALDAMYATTQFHDMMDELYNWRGVDGLGSAMECRVDVNSGRDYVNAFWNGTRTSYGHGNCTYGPLATLSIVGHEFMHGVTDYTSDLIYFAESGALNEALSDIYGKFLEFRVDPMNFSWELDAITLLDPEANPFRDMSDPRRRNDPAYYGGEFWRSRGTRSQDNSYVHSNSGVLNYWFYLLSEGGIGSNEVGYDYNIPPLGMEKAAEILWMAQTSYLTPTSQYQDIFEATLAIAEDLYGKPSVEYDAVAEAWTTVGLFERAPAPLKDLAISNEQAFSFCLDDGTFDLEIEVTNTGEETWTAGSEILFNLNSIFDGISEDRTVLLTETIAPGETATLVVENYDEVGYTGEDLFCRITLIDSADENHTNNSATFFGELFPSENPALTQRSLTIRRRDCDTTITHVEIAVSNESCTPLASGSSLTVHLMASDIAGGNVQPLESFTFVTDRDLSSGSTDFFTTTLENNSNFHKINTWEIEGGDVNSLDTIVYTVNVLSTPTISSTSNILDFEPENNPGVYFWGGGAHSGIYEEEGNHVLFSFARDNGDDVSCRRGFESLFNQNSANNNHRSNWTTCVDLSEVEDPVVSFDLIQFRNEEATILADDNTAILKISYLDSSGEQVHYIMGQEEGEVVCNTIPLPPYFNDEITFEFFSKVGDSSNAITFDGDIQFLDNLFFGPRDLVDTEESLKLTEYRIYPNPATDQIRLEGVEDQEAVIYNSVGQVVLSGILNSGQVYIGNLESGVYFVQLSTSKIPTLRFVKM